MGGGKIQENNPAKPFVAPSNGTFVKECQLQSQVILWLQAVKTLLVTISGRATLKWVWND